MTTAPMAMAPADSGGSAPPAAPPRAERYVAWLARRRGAILLLSLVLAGISALSLLRLRLDVDLLSMLPQGRQRFADYQRYVAHLAADPLGLNALLGEALARTRPDQALQPGSEYVVSRDGTRVLILLRPAKTGYDLEAAARLAAALAAAEERARQASGSGPEVSVGYTGAFAFALEDSSLLRTDMIVYSGLALAGVLAVFLLGYRTLGVLPLVTYQIVLGTLVTFALGLLVEGRLNAISLAFAVIFYGLGIDAAIHFYTRFLEEWGGDGAVERPLARTVASLLPATMVAATTSAIAFVAIGFSDFAGVSQLGFLSALGLVLNVPATFLLLPAHILWTHRHTGLLRAGGGLAPTVRLAALAAAIARHRVAVGVAALAVLLGAAVAARDARLDTNLFNLRPSRSVAAEVQVELEREFGLVDPEGAVVLAVPRAQEAAQDAAMNAALDEALLRAGERTTEMLERYRQEGLVETVLSPAGLLRRERLAAWAQLPRERAADALAARLAAEGFKTASFAGALDALRAVPAPLDPTLAPLPGLELLFERQLRRDEQGLAVLIPFRPRDVDALAAVAERLPADVASDVATGGVSVTVTGRPLMERELHATMRDEIVWFLLAVGLGNALLIWLRVRRAGVTAAIVAVPAAVVVLLLALLATTGTPIDAVNLIVFPLTIGLGVDNCVYLAERCRELGSVREAVASTGRPLAITAGTTAIGFGVLALSRYPALAGLGWLAATSILLCFVATVVLLPAILPRGWLSRERS